ncbi:MAG: hypothetical protein PF636_07475 [Actinomycetota bacterium]|nr:hypothetical protein [Actinomycetota bacterium]
MSDSTTPRINDDRLSALGLMGNPFRPRMHPNSTDVPLVRTIINSASLELLAKIHIAGSQESARPIRVLKSLQLPEYYPVNALVEVLAELASPESRILATYVPLELMKRGRVRSALNSLGERLTGHGLEAVLTNYTISALSDTDKELPEFAAIADADLDEIVQELADDPTALRRFYGEYIGEREGVDDLEMMMRVSQTRQDGVEVDPDETDDDDENNGADSLSEIYTKSLDDTHVAGTLHEADAEVEVDVDQPTEEDLAAAREAEFADAVVEYVAAYAKAHLSPVIARSIRAYKAQGASSCAQELKITKAPRKTLKSIVKFARYHFDSVAIIYDRFDAWPLMPQDVRVKIVTSLTDLRWALADGGVIVISHKPGQIPEIEEQFEGATQVNWEMNGLREYQESEPLTVEVVQGWLDSASIADEYPRVEGGVIGTLLTESENDGNLFCAMAAAAIDDAVERGVTTLDDHALEAGRKAAVIAN